MNDMQVQLVKESWRFLQSQENLIHNFYQYLFAIDPNLKNLFKRDLTMQGRKIFSMLGHTIEHLDALQHVIPSLIDSGSRHISYGVKPRDFDSFKQALLMILKEYHGENYHSKLEEAWIEAYSLIETTMCTTMKYSEAS